MANWNETINISGLHRLYTTGSINLQQVSQAIVRKLKNTEAFAISDPELIDIMCAFEAIDELAQLKDYNAVLDMLYGFGDKEHKLWVEAEGVSPQEHDDIPNKTKNPFQEDTKPNFSKPHYHGPWLTNPKEPGSGEWVKVPPITSPITYSTDTWEKGKMYSVGDYVMKGNLRYKCRISCANVDPTNNSFKATDCWEWITAGQTHSDPKLVFTDRITCELPAKGRVYASTRKHHYMSEEDFNKKLVASEIDPATVPKELYSYMKDSEPPYQEWLMQRWHKHNLTFRIPTPSDAV